MPYKNITKRLEYSRLYYLNNKESFKINSNTYRIKNKETIAKRTKFWYFKNLKTIAAYKHKWYLKNKLRILKMRKIYESEHKNEINKYNQNRRKININYRIAHNLRNRVLKVLKGINKSESTINLIGCSINLLKLHLQSKFRPGMSFKNYGKWHIDHIRPCASFDLSKPAEQKKCFHYTNLQPLWAKDNREKGDKIA